MKSLIYVLMSVALCTLVCGKDLLFDISTESVPVSHFKCVRQQYDEISMWLFWDENGALGFSMQNFQNAKNAGLAVHMGTTPCRSKNPASEIAAFK